MGESTTNCLCHTQELENKQSRNKKTRYRNPSPFYSAFSLSKSEYMSPTCFNKSARAEEYVRVRSTKEYVHVRGELPARALPSCTCRGGFRVCAPQKSTSTWASYRHAHSHRARAEKVPRVCAPQKEYVRVRSKLPARAPQHARAEDVPACALHKKEYVHVWRVTGTRTPSRRAEQALRTRAGYHLSKRVIFAISS